MKLRHLLFSILFACLAVSPAARADFAGQAQGIFTAGGSANALTLTIPNVVAYADLTGVSIQFYPIATNTGAATVNVDSLGAAAIVRGDGTTVQAGDLNAVSLITATYNGTSFVISTIFSQFAAQSTTQAFTTSTTWTPPAGVYHVKSVQVWGPGGGGGGALNGAAGGGGGGGYSLASNVSVTPGTPVTVTIGTGGAGGAGGSANGVAGSGASAFGSITAGAGAGGASSSGGGAGGAGGAGSGGAVNLTAQSGGPGFATSATIYGGGGGGASPLGGANPFLSLNSNGGPGLFPGGGANGGANSSGTTTGGVGANGYVIIQY